MAQRLRYPGPRANTRQPSGSPGPSLGNGSGSTAQTKMGQAHKWRPYRSGDPGVPGRLGSSARHRAQQRTRHLGMAVDRDRVYSSR
jgi:hypothetical protein